MSLYLCARVYLSVIWARWLNRDPSEEFSDANLYVFVENSPLADFDYLGLWDVKRQHLARANVVAEKEHESVRELAEKIGLDVAEYQRWLKPKKSYKHFDDRLALEKEICKGDEFTIPNQVIIVVGKTSFWPKPRKNLEKMASSGATTMYNKGFSVIYRNREVQKFTADDIISLAGNDMWGFAFFGHGTTAYWPFQNPAYGGDFKISKGETVTPEDMQQLSQFRYKNGMVIAYLCSAPFADWQRLVSPAGVFYGTKDFYQVNGADSGAVMETFKRASEK